MAMGEWKEYRLGDFMEFNPKESIKKGTVARKITMDLLVPHSRDIFDYVYEPYSGGAKFRNGDTIMARITPCLENGKHAFISLLDDGEVAYGSTEYFVMRGKEGISDNRFVYYLTHTPEFKATAIKSMVGSSGRQRAQVEVLENMVMTLPESLEEQRAIASQLSEIDDKIANNKHICEALDEQAQAIYKDWFVDLSPYSDGTNSSSEIKIPQGWKIGVFDDIIEETVSGDWGNDYLKGNYTHKVACIRGCDFQDVKFGLRGKTPERYILEKNFQSKRFHDKDILVEISGGTSTVSTGRVCPISQTLIDKYDGDVVCTNFCKVVRPSGSYGAYAYYTWLHKYNKKIMFAYENGTSGIKNFRIKDFTSREPIYIPCEKDVMLFQDMIDSIHQQIQTIGSESLSLGRLRDILLPKLMGGEIKL